MKQESDTRRHLYGGHILTKSRPMVRRNAGAQFTGIGGPERKFATWESPTVVDLEDDEKVTNRNWKDSEQCENMRNTVRWKMRMR